MWDDYWTSFAPHISIYTPNFFKRNWKKTRYVCFFFFFCPFVLLWNNWKKRLPRGTAHCTVFHNAQTRPQTNRWSITDVCQCVCVCVFVCADSLWLLRVFIMDEIKIKHDFKALVHLYPLSAYVTELRAEKWNMHRLRPDKTSYSVVMRHSSVLGINWARPRFILNLLRLFLSFAFQQHSHSSSFHLILFRR